MFRTEVYSTECWDFDVHGELQDLVDEAMTELNQKGSRLVNLDHRITLIDH